MTRQDAPFDDAPLRDPAHEFEARVREHKASCRACLAQPPAFCVPLERLMCDIQRAGLWGEIPSLDTGRQR